MVHRLYSQTVSQLCNASAAICQGLQLQYEQATLTLSTHGPWRLCGKQLTNWCAHQRFPTTHWHWQRDLLCCTRGRGLERPGFLPTLDIPPFPLFQMLSREAWDLQRNGDPAQASPQAPSGYAAFPLETPTTSQLQRIETTFRTGGQQPPGNP